MPAGQLTAREDRSLHFAYAANYRGAGGLPLSLSLPIVPPTGEAAPGDARIRAFFGNLLPENDQLDRVIAREGLDRDDLVGILHHFGADCTGALSCLPAGSPPAKVPGVLAEDYRPLDDDELRAIVDSLADHQRLPGQMLDPSPLAGVQRKIALTRLPDGRFALPREGRRVPSTHILKVPRRADAADVADEVAACRLADAAGLAVSIPEALMIGDMPALLIPRFDRRIAGGVVHRIHQEDFAQAMGLPAALKYERRGAEGRRYDAAAIAALINRSQRPAQAREAFLLATFLNLAIGNVDNHAKNHGLLYAGGPVPGLAPLYDLLPVRLNDQFTDELAFRMGAATRFDDLQPGDVADFLATFGLRRARARRFIEGPVAAMLGRLEAASAALAGRGLKRFDDLIGRELAQLCDLLALPLPIRPRDYF